MPDTINAVDLPAETANTLDGTECVVGFDTTQGKKITVDQLAEYVLQKKLSTLAGSSQTVAAALTALNSKLTLETYSNNGLIIYRVGKTAQLATLPVITTTSSSAVVATIPAGPFRPASRVWFATKVFNGSSYVDCYIELATNGEISIKSNTGAVVAGYQANYTQCLGMNFLCVGN